MIIVETCPKCGHDLQDLVLASNPPIPQKKCFSCGWEWTGEPEQVLRVPFGGNSLEYDKTWLHGNTDYECVNADCCMVNNLNRSVYEINAVDLENIHKNRHNDIDAAIARIVKYLDKKE